jgi:rhamnosyl/mannosyltransferase
LLGKVRDLRSYYKAAKVFVLPSISRAEAFGIVQLEAMAAGLPVVNTDIDSGVPEVSVNGETGLTVPPADADALASALQLLLNSEDQRVKMGEAARTRAEIEYSVEKMVSRTARVYEGVLSSAPTVCATPELRMDQKAQRKPICGSVMKVRAPR